MTTRSDKRTTEEVRDAGDTLKVSTFFWEGEHEMTDEKFLRVQHIREILANEICCDRGLAMQLVLTEMPEEELQVLEMFARRCQEVRAMEVEQANMPAFTIFPL